MPDESGYDRCLESLYGRNGYFFMNLYTCIRSADEENLARIALGYPEDVEAFLLYREKGPAALAAKVSPDHPLLKLWCKDDPDVEAMFRLTPAVSGVGRTCSTS